MNQKISAATKAAASDLQLSYLSGGTWQTFGSQVQAAIDGIEIQTGSDSPFYLQYRTWNQGKADYYPYVKSNENDYAGSSGKPIQQLQIQAYQNDGTKLSSGIVVMYRAYVEGAWLPWVSNADPEWMRSVQSKYNLGGTLDTSGYYAGTAGKNISGVEIRVYEEGSLGDFTGGETGASLSCLTDSTWNTFTNSTLASHIDGVKIQTSAQKDYYLSYKTWNSGQPGYYPAVKSTENDYAGSAGKPIQTVAIQVFQNSGAKLTSGVIVMYRAYVDGAWLPWVSNADPEWMRNMQSKYSLGGTLDTSGYYAGIEGKNIGGLEIRIFEDDTSNPGSGSLPGAEVPLTMRWMANSASNWQSFSQSVFHFPIDGLEIRTSGKDYYLSYKTRNAGQPGFYPAVRSTENDYAGSAGKPIQTLSIEVFKNDGTKLKTGVVVMYRAYVDGGWLPWVSNADPEWMENAQMQYNLGGTLDTTGFYAGIDGKNIAGVEIRAFEGSTTSLPNEDLPGAEGVPALSYMADSETSWKSFQRSVLAPHIDGIKIQTSSGKPYSISYQTLNSGKSYYYPEVTSKQNDYAGYPGKPIQLLSLHVYKNGGAKLTTGVVVMYRAHVEDRWLSWVSNADPEWMRAVQAKYSLGGTLDTEGYYAGIPGKNINGIELRVFEENTTNITPPSPSGKYKIIHAPFLSQLGKYPTGCESVSTVMALNYWGIKTSVDTFIDSFLYKTGTPFDPSVSFGGDPRSTSGYGCYAPVIKQALDKALTGKNYAATVLNGASLSSLCSSYIDNNIPVILWATMFMRTPYVSSSWMYNHRVIEWVAPEHCLLLVGYDDNNYIFNDPLKPEPLTYYSKQAVEVAYNGLHSQAVVIQEHITPPKPNLDVAELERIDRSILMNTYYYSAYYNANHTEIAEISIPNNFNDYNILALLQLLYAHFYDQRDFEKTDMLYDEMLVLRKLNPSYKTIYARFLNSSGEFNMGYLYYAPGRKTAKIHFEAATYFTVDTIQQMHNSDSWLAFMAALIPGVGPFLSPLLSEMKDLEQSGKIGFTDKIVEDISGALVGKFFDVIIKKLNAPAYVALALNTYINFENTAYGTANENRVTYIKDGVTLQDGDSYIQVKLRYDMGIEHHDFRLYFRNGYPLVTDLEQYVGRWDDAHQGLIVTMDNWEEFSKDGYVPSKVHKPRGPYWPLKE